MTVIAGRHEGIPGTHFRLSIDLRHHGVGLLKFEGQLVLLGRGQLDLQVIQNKVQIAAEGGSRAGGPLIVGVVLGVDAYPGLAALAAHHGELDVAHIGLVHVGRESTTLGGGICRYFCQEGLIQIDDIGEVIKVGIRAIAHHRHIGTGGAQLVVKFHSIDAIRLEAEVLWDGLID